MLRGVRGWRFGGVGKSNCLLMPQLSFCNLQFAMSCVPRLRSGLKFDVLCVLLTRRVKVRCPVCLAYAAG